MAVNAEPHFEFIQEAMLVGGILKGWMVADSVGGGPGADGCWGWRHMYQAAVPIALVMGLGVVSLLERRGLTWTDCAVKRELLVL